MRSKLFSGIFGHFFLRSSTIQIASGLLLLIFVLPFFDYVSNEMAAEQGRTFASSTLAATSDGLYKNEYSQVVDYCMGVMKDTPNILFIVYSKKNGEELIITSEKWALENKTLPYYNLTFKTRDVAESIRKAYIISDEGNFFNRTTSFKYNRPIFISGKNWGVLTIAFSKKAYFSTIENFYWTVTGFTVASCLLSFYLFFASSRRIRKQMSTFEGIAHELSKGKLTVKASESAIGEIGVLGKAINSMSNALIEKSARLSQLAQIVEQTNDVFILFNTTYHVIFVNDAVLKLTGFLPSYFMQMSMVDFISILNIKLDEVLQDFDAESTNKKSTLVQDVVIVKNDQTLVNVEIHLEYISNDQNNEKNLLVVLSNITQRKKIEAEILVAATAFESQEGMCVTDANNHILKVNKAFSDITGYSAEEVVGQSPRMLSSGLHDADFYATLWTSVNNTGHWDGEIYNRRKNGEVYPQHLTITVVKNADGIVANYVATLTDITLNKAAAEEIEHLAFYDPLTLLPNRRLLLDRLNHALAASARSGQQGALLFLDLDHFKTLNDTRGHDVGDLLLQQVAERLLTCVREGDTVARLGGDEFVVVLEDLSEEDLEAAAQAETIANKILATLNQPYSLIKHKHLSTPSIGVTLFNGHQSATEELLKQADIAMYQAKKAGRNTLRFFNPQMQANITARVELERELRRALEHKEFQLHYQIQVDNLDHPLGAEALIRWMHPERGLVTPFNFIPMAEETGLILPIGQWVLDTACAQLKAWEKNKLTSELTLSVNVSARQFRQVDFVEQVQSAVKYHAIKPMRLKLELTESLLLENVEDTVVSMIALEAVGVQFSLDDFGTGYSSLQYLKLLPLNQLKIDQSFVRDIVTDSSDRAIVRTIVGMAQSLNLNVIAEGVETKEQRALLLSNECMRFQGYLFGRPVPIEQFEESLKLG